MGGLLTSAKMLVRRQMSSFPETMKKFRKIKLDLLIKFDLLNRH
jgi:hypothetical protein